MSQIYKSSASGPVPPTVATSYVTDSGTAVPVANILNVLGNDSTADNANGISTTGSGNTVTAVLSNRYRQTTTTVGVASSVMTILSALAAGAYVFDMSIAGYATAGGPAADGYTLTGAVRSTGAACTLLPNQQVDEFEEGINTGVVLGVSGNDVILTVTGEVGQTINWLVVGTYITIS